MEIEHTGEQHTREPLLFTALTLLLLGVGLTVLYSASYDRALRLGLPGNYFFERQLIFAVIGLSSAAIAAVLSPRIIRKLIPLLLFASVITMLMTSFTSFGETRLGARRWLELGPLSFQPSELLKLAVIFYIAHYIDRRGPRIREFWQASVPVAVIMFGAILILLQRDFSTTIIFVFLSFSVLLVGGMKITHLLYFGILTAIPGLLLMITQPYRLRRIVGFLFPNLDPSGINYQLNASVEAIASGRLFGKGFGQGTYKLGRIPEVQSDFIFSAFAEEFGFFGVAAVIVLFAMLAFLGFRGASRQYEHSRFSYIAGFGCVFLIIWQVLINVSVVSGIIPPTGIPLPLFSSGGTSLVITLAVLGFLLGIMLRTPDETDDDTYSSHPRDGRDYRPYEL
ncbi:MAG: FtsW/RodA/SpoVE family cell cycle protein [Spirochaetota bacterium]